MNSDYLNILHLKTLQAKEVRRQQMVRPAAAPGQDTRTSLSSRSLNFNTYDLKKLSSISCFCYFMEKSAAGRSSTTPNETIRKLFLFTSMFWRRGFSYLLTSNSPNPAHPKPCWEPGSTPHPGLNRHKTCTEFFLDLL